MHKTKNNITTIRTRLTFKNICMSCNSSLISDNIISSSELHGFSVVGLSVAVMAVLSFTISMLPFTVMGDVSTETVDGKTVRSVECIPLSLGETCVLSVVVLTFWLGHTILSIQGTNSVIRTKFCGCPYTNSVEIPTISCWSFNRVAPAIFKVKTVFYSKAKKNYVLTLHWSLSLFFTSVQTFVPFWRPWMLKTL